MNKLLTKPIMKKIAKLIVATVSFVMLSCSDKNHDISKATPTQGSMVLAFNEAVPWETSFVQWSACLGNAGAGDTITVVSGPLGRSASFKVSLALATKTLEARVDIASADENIIATTKLLKDISECEDESVSLPKLLTLIRENITSDTRKAVITSSTLNQDREEPAFSFNGGKYPSDGHLKASINDTPFATHGDELSNLSVIWNDSAKAEDFMNDIHRQSVRRFVTGWIQNQGASIQYDSKTTERAVAINSDDRTVEMRVAPTRSAPVVVSQPTKQVAPQPAKAPKQSELIREALKQTNEVSLEIKFDLDSARINEESAPLLESAAAAINDKGYESQKFIVEGHTSSEGDAQHNQLLSEKRAASVIGALIRNGVDKSRLTGIGCGSSKPLYAGAQEASRAANRRVIIRRVDFQVAKQN